MNQHAPIVPDKLWYVKSKSREDLSYMCQEGTASNIKKMKETGRKWAGSKDDEHVVDNVPISGFEIIKWTVRYTTSNVVWRIRDPRGFVLEIYSGNMSYLLNHCTIERGKISSKCIWGRSGGKNILIPEGSQEYTDAMTKTTTLKKKVKRSDVKTGYIIRLKSGERVRYLGKSKVISYDIYEGPFTYIETPKPQFLFERLGEGDDKAWEIMTRASLDVVEILDTEHIEYDLLQYTLDWRQANKQLHSKAKGMDYSSSSVKLACAKDDIDIEILLRDHKLVLQSNVHRKSDTYETCSGVGRVVDENTLSFCSVGGDYTDAYYEKRSSNSAWGVARLQKTRKPMTGEYGNRYTLPIRVIAGTRFYVDELTYVGKDAAIREQMRWRGGKEPILAEFDYDVFITVKSTNKTVKLSRRY